MKRLLILLVFFISALIANAQVTFQKTFGGTNADIGYSVQKTIDGGYIIAGSTRSFSAGYDDVYLIKIDANGDTLWTKTFGGTNIDVGFSVASTIDSGYIITGYTSSFGAGLPDIYLIKTDGNGNASWTRSYGGINIDAANSVIQSADGGYVISGHTSSFGLGNEDAYLIKTNAYGDTIWTKVFGGSFNDRSDAVYQTNDGGYIIAGSTTSFSFGGYDVYLAKTDSTGALLWTKTFGGTGYDYGYAVQQTSDGGYIITGNTESFGADSADVYLVKTDSAGNLIWSKTYGGAYSDYGTSVKQTFDGGYIIAGYTNSFGNHTYDVYLIRTDSNGDTLWTKTFGGSNTEFGYGVDITNDGGYIICGRTYSTPLVSDVYLIKVDSNGNSGCNEGNPSTIVTSPVMLVANPATITSLNSTVISGTATVIGSGCTINTLCTSVGINETVIDNSFFISPNPFNQYLTISTNQFINNKTEIKLFDIYGRIVLSQPLTTAPDSNRDTKLQTGKLSSGIYIYEVRNNSGVIKKGKVVKE